MKTKTQMAFFQHKKPFTIRRNQEKLKKSNNKNSTLNFYKVSSKIFDASDILTHSIDNNKFLKKKNNFLNSESIPKMGKSIEKKMSNESIENKHKFLISNGNYYQRSINNNLKNNSIHKSDNSVLVDNLKNRYNADIFR